MFTLLITSYFPLLIWLICDCANQVERFQGFTGTLTYNYIGYMYLFYAIQNKQTINCSHNETQCRMLIIIESVTARG